MQSRVQTVFRILHCWIQLRNKLSNISGTLPSRIAEWVAREFMSITIIRKTISISLPTGGSGFGIMGLIAGIERGYITRQQGLERFGKIVSFLEKADRFHGAWSHWIDGETGHVKPFGRVDNGGDLVETSFLLQGLLCVRQYFKDGNDEEQHLSARIDTLWRQVEFDWYRHDRNVLYWHWSPEYGWRKNFPVHGYNECLIMYVLAASSPTHGVPVEVYNEGWAEKGRIKGLIIYDHDTLRLRHQGDPPHGGPFVLGSLLVFRLDPRGLTDRYADYWKENSAQARMNYNWCVDNPKHFKATEKIIGD
jgi:hypothetical protein